ncbi:transposase [Candidatus Pacearchaeota archaeon]|nr:transposase [Candidatus Pacearchaeota archaeon]
MNIEKAMYDDRLMRAVIGMCRKEFSELLKKFAPLVSRVKYKRNRKRKAGAGRTHTLETPEQKLFYMLFYMKCYPTFDVAGFFFEVDKSQAKRWVDELRVMLEKALGKAMVLPVRKIRSVEEFLKRFPAVRELLIDGTERPVQRPKDKKTQKERYSGKKRKHTQKNIVAASRKKEILLLGKTQGGQQHDYPMLKKNKLPEVIPKNIPAYLDLGFKGIQKDYALKILMPFRKPRTRDLTKTQKRFNKKVSRFRVRVENAIAGVKRLRCITDVCRNKSEQLKDHLMWLSCGLWNFHLKAA